MKVFSIHSDIEVSDSVLFCYLEVFCESFLKFSISETMIVWELLLLVSVVVYLLYKWATRYYNTFEERGIPYTKPWPVVGNNLAIIMNKESMFTSILKFYQGVKEHKIHGYFNFRLPFFLVNDPELIKKITIKDFDHFPNHSEFFPTESDELLDGMLSVMKDQRWRNMRNTLSPVFTSAKMRNMFVLMNECFEESLRYIHNLPKTPDGAVEIELKQCFTKLSNDLIASTAFGLKINSYENSDNDFYLIGQAITSFRGKQMFKFLMASVAPKIMNLLGIKVFDAQKTAYFTRLVVDTMKYRQEHNIVRHDMIQLLMEAKKEAQEQWTDVELVSQCFIFFFAAFENNANFICTTCHELMLNPDIQQRLYEEAVELRSQLKGARLSHEDINKMKYMDMVLSESLRLWSLAAVTDRVCSKDYTATDEDGNVVVEFKKGDRIWFPISGLHRDEKYFENPDAFDPERFSEENKHHIKPCTYIPFGVGPRVCIGNRYALMQAKAMLYYLILEFKIERSPKTVKDLLTDIRGFQINPENGFWVKLVPRK